MKRGLIVIITLLSILSLSGCWRYYHHHDGYDHHDGNDRGYHHMWNDRNDR
ncbi:MAG: hypothetical protein ABIK68_06585 [bacterium]